ncbi:MAG: hypothetical protein KDA37_06625 [Planctomycetales bacterium]|nr:hypothetical protein [Planctomycetales bacterium]
MSRESVAGQPVGASIGVGPRLRSVGVWQRWQSLRGDILRHVHECDRLGECLTVDKLANDLDEALGLVERRVQELQSLRLLCVHADRRIELPTSSRRMCG